MKPVSGEFEVRTLLSFVELAQKLQKESWSRWWFRGLSDAQFGLIPKAGRYPALLNDKDRHLFEAWKRQAVALLDVPPRPFNELDLLCIAQHHGLATRLLDWTRNPLVALFFAIRLVGDARSASSAVLAHYSEMPAVELEGSGSPHDVALEVCRLTPNSVAPRVLRQGGLFTIHRPANRDLYDALRPGERLVRFLIPASAREDLLCELSHAGVNEMSMFPDLDGLSGHMNWVFLSLPYP